VLEGTLYTTSAQSEEDGIDFDNIDFLSFINGGTFGKPAIIAPGEDHVAGETRVLYVNTALVVAVEVTKQ
jgi:hypothetical protein